MVLYLSEEEIVKINELSLGEEEKDKFCYQRPDYVKFTLKFVRERFGNNYYKKALSYCISLVVLHPFQEGNHRTSLYCAQIFLKKNNFKQLATPESVKQIQKWRIDRLIENDRTLMREFFRIAGIEDENERRIEIENVMNYEYGLEIEKWLKNNYTKK